MTTYQSYLNASDHDDFIIKAIENYKTSPLFSHALEALAYFRAENPPVMRKTILRAGVIERRDKTGILRSRPTSHDVVGNRVSSSFFQRFVVQQNQFLLSEGIQVEDRVRKKLGADFDRALSRLGEFALIQGTAWGFWNADHLEVIEIAKNPLSGFFPLVDELDGRIRMGVQFWQLDEDHPMSVRLFDQFGETIYVSDGKSLQFHHYQQPYRRIIAQDAFGETVVDTPTYDMLPLVPLHANPEHRSELTPSIRAKIDAYDRILSDFADNLDRANDVYWVLNNFGGTSDDIANLLEEIARLKAVANISDGTGSATAEPKTIEVPYAARRAALDILEHELYQDYMALDIRALTGGSLTNVAIRAAMANLNLKSDRYEWQIMDFMADILTIIEEKDAPVKFRRQCIANESEIVADIYRMREDISHAAALRLNPYLQSDELPLIEEELAQERHADQDKFFGEPPF